MACEESGCVLQTKDIEAKRRFYGRAEVARDYDRQRFGGPSGQYVNQREIGLVERLLPAGGSVLDVGSGTGRLARELARRGDRVTCCDASAAMLREGQSHGLRDQVQGDGFALPFASGAFDGAVALRLLFHFADVAELLHELRRVVSAGGSAVCDTYAWSARARLPLQAGKWGPSVYAIAPRDFETRAATAGWAVDGVAPCFIGSPYLYKLLPEAVCRKLEGWERGVPDRFLARRFWGLRAV